MVQYIYICIFYFKAVMKSKMKDQILPKYLNRLTKFLNDHGERYFVGSKVKLFIAHLVCIFPFATQLTLLTSRAGTDHASACLVRIRITLLSELLGFFPASSLYNIFYTFILYKIIFVFKTQW